MMMLVERVDGHGEPAFRVLGADGPVPDERFQHVDRDFLAVLAVSALAVREVQGHARVVREDLVLKGRVVVVG